MFDEQPVHWLNGWGGDQSSGYGGRDRGGLWVERWLWTTLQGAMTQGCMGTAEQIPLCRHFPPTLWTRSTGLHPALRWGADNMDCMGGHPSPLSWSWEPWKPWQEMQGGRKVRLDYLLLWLPSWVVAMSGLYPSTSS